MLTHLLQTLAFWWFLTERAYMFVGQGCFCLDIVMFSKFEAIVPLHNQRKGFCFHVLQGVKMIIHRNSIGSTHETHCINTKVCYGEDSYEGRLFRRLHPFIYGNSPPG